MDEVDCLFFCASKYFQSKCPDDPLADNLTSTRWPTVFGGAASDAIVPVTSQLNGLTGSRFEAVHSPGTRELGFGGPDEYEENSGIPNRVIELLNTPVTDSAFSLLP